MMEASDQLQFQRGLKEALLFWNGRNQLAKRGRRSKGQKGRLVGFFNFFLGVRSLYFLKPRGRKRT